MIWELLSKGVKLNAEGKPQEAIAAWTEMMKYQRANYGSPKMRYLCAESWTAGIGHIALLDFFVKRRLLGLSDCDYTIVHRPTIVANRYYLLLWLKHFTFGKRIPDMERWEDWPTVLEVGNNEWLPLEDAVWKVNQLWTDGPVISMPPDKIADGWTYLKSIGVKDWFVTFHFRQPGPNDPAPSVRDIMDPQTYAGAVKKINDAGGSAIRIGATPLGDPVKGLIDLAGAYDWIDTFLISQCRFFVGSNSGPSVAACTFGVPVLICNFAPRGALFPHKVKLLRKHVLNADGDEVPSNEWSLKRLQEQGLTSQDNTEREITEAVAGML